MPNKKQIHVHIDGWMKEYLEEASRKTKLPVSELLRLFTALTILELSKASGYKPEIDAAGFYTTLKKDPSMKMTDKVSDTIMHDARKAVEFRFQNDLILKITKK